MLLIASLKSECHWIALVSIAIIAISVVFWLATRDSLPKTIRIAPAHEGELYHEFGEALKKSLISRDEPVGRSPDDLCLIPGVILIRRIEPGQATQLIREELRSDQGFLFSNAEIS